MNYPGGDCAGDQRCDSTLPFEFVQQVERFNGCEVVDVGGAQAVDDFLRDWGKHSQLDLRFRIAGVRSKMCCGFAFGIFMLMQDLACTNDDFRGKTGQLGHFNSVAAVSGAGLDLPQKDDSTGIFFHRDVEILDSLKPVQFRQLMVVGGEERFGAAGGMNVFDNGPGDGETIIRCGSAANLVQQDERARCGSIQDGGG